MSIKAIQTTGIAELSLEQKVGQMLFARHHTLLDDPRYAPLIERGLIGGIQVAPLAATPFSAELRDQINARMLLPVLVGADAEEGGALVCRQGTPIPCAGALGSLGCAKTAQAMARITARQLLATGINTVFGPVFDVNLFPDGVMALRAYGSTMENVARLGTAVLQGYLDEGLVATAKHYPGGSSHSIEDNHIASAEHGLELEAIAGWDMLAYRAGMRIGMNAVMTTHHPVQENGRCLPATFSRAALDLLRAEGFDGIIVSDSLAMASLRTQWDNAEIIRMAMLAGHDMLLVDYAQDPAEAFEMMLSVARSGALSEERLNAAVARILRAKRRLAGLAPVTLSAADHERNAQAVRAAAARAICLRNAAPFDLSAPCLLLINRASGPAVRNEVVLQGRHDGFERQLQEIFPRAESVPVAEWPVREIEGVLRRVASVERVVMVAESPNHAYRGTVDYSEPLLALIRAIRCKLHAFVHFGNPNAVRRLPPDLKNLMIAFSGATAEQAVCDVLRDPALARGRFDLPG